MGVPPPIHPFPARMAPEVALTKCEYLPHGSIVLDPMCGSGTVVRAAAERGLIGLGFDTDPLAVLMTNVWTTPLDPESLRQAARSLVAEAELRHASAPSLPWIDEDPETRRFVDYWFGPSQQADLRRLCAVLVEQQGSLADGLRIALSRIIITKDRGASLGRDVSHSRPHRAFTNNDFAVKIEFMRSADRLAHRLAAHPPPGRAGAIVGDARDLGAVGDHSIDAVMTSPPYLNALDYIRGHRLSLVWLGYQVGDLRTVRAENIGSERAPEPGSFDRSIDELTALVGDLDDLPVRIRQMICRYVVDLTCVMREVRRILKPGGGATFVVGNSCLRGVFIDNAAAVAGAARRAGLDETGRRERELPPSRRYLPPPLDSNPSGLTKRMRSEVVLSFVC